MEQNNTPQTPEEVEQALNKAKDQINRHNPEDVAAAFFKMEQPKFKKLIESLSHRQLKRLVFQLVSGPLVQQQYVATSEEEKRAYYLGDQMIYNRMIMQLSMEMQKAEEAVQKEKQNLEETNKLIEGEKVNG